MAKNERRILVLGDIHAPYHDKRAIALAHKCVKAFKPDTIVQIGDAVDCYAISTYPKHPERKAKLQYEVEAAANVLKPFIASCDEFHLTAGNHEYRLEKFLATKAPELFGLVEMRELLELDAQQWHDYRAILKIGKCHFTHEVGYCGGGAAAKSLAAFGGNLVFGHSHRPEVVYERNLRGEGHFCMNVGWLGSHEYIDYAHVPRVKSWHHGVGLVTENARGEAWATFVPFVHGKCIIEGKEVRL